ncbi:MAG TPA: small ribosomal subunit Rsm22 family protein [Terracidiphilus sp.]|nr:small ribosomal subunit Rsm22 family protein [Terracidiphilus sp.]
MEFPPELREAISRMLEGVSRTALGERAQRISELYRGGGGSAVAIRDEMDALAYVVTRLPATYGAIRQVLQRLQERCAEFRPRNILDLGCGPGTASWASVHAWPEIESIAQVDSNGALLELGRKLARTASAKALRGADQVTDDISWISGTSRTFEFVILSYTLAELAQHQIESALNHAWLRCAGALAIVEPGTPAGYTRILLARDQLRALRARMLAPCPHELACPLAASDWCHFAQRVSRTRDHIFLKGAELPYEDEKFAYLIVVREPLFRPAEKSRILARPEINKAGFTSKLCTLEGQCELVSIGRRDAQVFKRARKLVWGDELQLR